MGGPGGQSDGMKPPMPFILPRWDLPLACAGESEEETTFLVTSSPLTHSSSALFQDLPTKSLVVKPSSGIPFPALASLLWEPPIPPPPQLQPAFPAPSQDGADTTVAGKSHAATASSCGHGWGEAGLGGHR